MNKRKTGSKKKNDDARHAASIKTPKEFETMSQQQNRHGKGREQNGSDGSTKARGSNH